MKTYLFLSLLLCVACASDPKKGATSGEVDKEVSLKGDQEEIQKLRKEIPEEIRKSNDRLAEVLKRWKVVKTPPDQLREKFNDEITKQRSDLEKVLKRKREDFNRSVSDRRKEFQSKQKEERDDFYGSKPKQDQRQNFSSRQSVERDRFNSDLRDERDRFEDEIKEQRKNFDSEIANKRLEFKQEYPEYKKIYDEMKKEEEKQREANKNNPKPYAGWPYKEEGAPAETGSGTTAAPSVKVPAKSMAPSEDVNQGGNGWPSTDPAELNQVPNPPKAGN